MAENSSLKNLLQILVTAPEPAKKAVLCALLRALKEACGLFQTSGVEYWELAKKTQKILDEIVGVDSRVQTLPQASIEEEEDEDEFVESGTYPDEKAEAFATQPRIPVTSDDSLNGRLASQIEKWNGACKTWLKLPPTKVEEMDSVIALILTMMAHRSNVTSNQFDEQEAILQKFDENWQETMNILEEAGFEIKPGTLTPKGTSNVQGKVIYTCRPRSTEEEVELVAPAIFFNRQMLREPVWVISLPMDAEFPANHANASLPSHWRGVFGEIDLMIEHMDMQPNAFAAVEGINKNRLDPLDECRANVIAETRRRAEVLKATIEKKESESIYRLATDYWRVEECFWSVFHDDDRAAGCSYFDRMRTRLQAWRTTLRRILKFHIRDFACGSDSLASVNQYIGNIIVQQRKNASAGTVIRELRPAIVVKEQATSRLLKGRVIAT